VSKTPGIAIQKGRAVALLRATRSSETHSSVTVTSLYISFWAPGFGTPNFFAVCSARASAQKTPQNTGKTLFSEKSADQGTLIRRFFKKSLCCRGFVVVPARFLALGTQRENWVSQALGPETEVQTPREPQNPSR